jgi:hypothetical protein
MTKPITSQHCTPLLFTAPIANEIHNVLTQTRSGLLTISGDARAFAGALTRGSFGTFPATAETENTASYQGSTGRSPTAAAIAASIRQQATRAAWGAPSIHQTAEPARGLPSARAAPLADNC